MKSQLSRHGALSFCLCLPLVFSGCSSGDGSDGNDVPSPSYSVTVTVTGLVGSGLQLQNGADTLAVGADGAATFATKLPRGARYSVTVLSQPTVPAQICEVGRGEGTIASGDVTDVVVPCVTSAATRFAYAVNYAGGSISIYNVDSATGQLRMRGYAKAGTASVAAAHDPAGRFTYVLNSGLSPDPSVPLENASISVFERDNVSGDLREVDGSPFVTSLTFSISASLTLHPTGKFLYVTNDEGTIFQASVGADGALSQITDEPVFTSGSSPGPLLLDPAGRFAYLTHAGFRGHAEGIDVYEVDETTGELQERAALHTQLAGDLRIVRYAFHPSGRLLCVVYQQHDVAQAQLAAFFADPATGALTPVRQQPLALPLNPTSGLVFAVGGRFAYLSASGDARSPGSLVGFSIDAATGALSALALSPYTTGVRPGPPVLTASGEFLYVASRGSSDAGNASGAGSISAFSIEPATGALTRLLDIETAEPGPTIADIDPSGHYLYVSSVESDRIYAYRIDASGGLNALPQGAVIRAGDGPASIDTFVSPTTATPAVFVPRFAYLSHPRARLISSLTIDAGTGLLQVSGITPSSTSPYALALSSDGRSLYSSEAVNPEGPANISTYSIDAATGALAANPMGSVVTPVPALDIAADPSGRFVYASNHVNGAVTPYKRDVDTGALNPNGDPVPTIAEPFRLAIDPTGRDLYVLSPQQIQVFSIDPRSGALRAGAITRIGQPGTPMLATNLALEPGGKFLYIVNVDGSIETYPVDARSGALGPVSTTQTERGYAAIAVEPRGQFLYAGSQLSVERSILVYSIAQDTGALTIVGSATLPEDPRLLATEISGKYLYAELFNGIIVTFGIDQLTGGLTIVASGPGAMAAGETRSFVTMGTVQ